MSSQCSTARHSGYPTTEITTGYDAWAETIRDGPPQPGSMLQKHSSVHNPISDQRPPSETESFLRCRSVWGPAGDPANDPGDLGGTASKTGPNRIPHWR